MFVFPFSRRFNEPAAKIIEAMNLIDPGPDHVSRLPLDPNNISRRIIFDMGIEHFDDPTVFEKFLLRRNLKIVVGRAIGTSFTHRALPTLHTGALKRSFELPIPTRDLYRFFF